jgi:signal transduction histidine kinase
MNYKRLAQWSIAFVLLIFLSQTYLIVTLYRVNHSNLSKVVRTITQDAYTKDVNLRLKEKSSLSQPSIEYMDAKDVELKSLRPYKGGYNIDAMKGVDKSSLMSLINITMEMYLSDINPIRLSRIDSLAAILLEKENIHTSFYTRIVDLKKDSVLQVSKPGIVANAPGWASIQSKNIPLNFQQDKVLQLVLLSPLKAVFTQMAGMLVLSLLLSLFCIYCLYILQRTLARQKKLAQSKNDFYNQVSHELKRPVSTVMQAIDTLQNTNAIEHVERRTRYMDVSMEELQRMNSKIDMILTLSKEEEGMFKLQRTEFDLPDLIEELRDRYYIGAAKPVELEWKDELLHPLIWADRDHLFQCISNLIDNAIKYSGDSVHIVVRLQEEGSNVVVAVQDNGVGIRPEDQARIFEKFERIRTERKANGYGIGLNYVKQVIEKHHGTVTVESELGQGSTFTLRLPRSKSVFNS